MGGVQRDLIGKRFGKLTVIDRDKSTTQGVIWVCLCDCDTITMSAAGALNAGQRVSCGCIHLGKNSHKYTGYMDIGGSYWKSIQINAKKRNIAFSISVEEAWKKYESQNRKCVLSGLDIFLSSSYTYKAKNQTASLDRIDNNLGYTSRNIQWLHKDVNRMKNVHDQEYFVHLCDLISRRKS